MSTVSAGLVKVNNLTVTGTQAGAIDAVNLTAENVNTQVVNTTNLYVGSQVITQSQLDAFLSTQSFITTWNVAANTVVLPLPDPSLFASEYPGTTIYDFVVYWGDSSNSYTHITSANYNTANSHTYIQTGQVTITINGTIRAWSFGSVPDSADMITSVVQWGSLQLINMPDMTMLTSAMLFMAVKTEAINQPAYPFQSNIYDPVINGTVNYANFCNCVNLTLDNVKDTPNLSSVHVLTGMFYNCTSLVKINNLKAWNTNDVKDMSFMFCNCENFNSSISGWNISSLESDYGYTSEITGTYAGMSFMFASYYAGIGAFNNGGEALTFTGLPASNSCLFMFMNQTVFNNGAAPLTSAQPFVLDTSTINDMTSMFNGTIAFNQPLRDPMSTVANVVQWNQNEIKQNTLIPAYLVTFAGNPSPGGFSGMFQGSSFNQTIKFSGTPNVAGVGMDWMFCGSAFNNGAQNGETIYPMELDTSQVVNMASIFGICSRFNQSMNAFDISKCGDLTLMFIRSPLYNNGGVPVVFSTPFCTDGVNAYYMFGRTNNFNNGDVVGGTANPLTWDTLHITNMGNMFTDCTVFNQTLRDAAGGNGWNINGLAGSSGIRLMFRNAFSYNNGGNELLLKGTPTGTCYAYQVFASSSFNNGAALGTQGPAFKLDTSKFRSMQTMFQGSPFNCPLQDQSGNSGWDISSLRVVNSNGAICGLMFMFQNNPYFNQPVVLKGTNANSFPVSGMFHEAKAFSAYPPIQDISGNWFNTSHFNDMSWMFYNAKAFNHSLASLNITGVIPNLPYFNLGGMTNMLLGSGISSANVDASIVAWASAVDTSNVVLTTTEGYVASGAALTAVNTLKNTWGWTVDTSGVAGNDSSNNITATFRFKDFRSIYNVPEPTFTTTKVIGVVALGYIRGELTPTGVVRKDPVTCDVYADLQDQGIAPENWPTIIIKDIYNSGASYNQANSGSYYEENCDVYTVAGLCTSANVTIIVYFAPAGLYSVTDSVSNQAYLDISSYAVNNRVVATDWSGNTVRYPLPSVMTNSWGSIAAWTPVTLAALEEIGNTAQLNGINYCHAAGNAGGQNGIDNWALDVAPNLICCGGTLLVASNNTRDAGCIEFASPAGSGGGTCFPMPSWQQCVYDINPSATGIYPIDASGLKHRLSPDVTALMGTGGYTSGNGFGIQNGTLAWTGGGTSMANPLVASIIACMDVDRDASGNNVFILPYLYYIYADPSGVIAAAYADGSGAYPYSQCFNDIKIGANGGGSFTYFAQSGYDNCSGLGSLNATKLASTIKFLQRGSYLPNYSQVGYLPSWTYLPDNPPPGLARVANDNDDEDGPVPRSRNNM